MSRTRNRWVWMGVLMCAMPMVGTAQDPSATRGSSLKVQAVVDALERKDGDTLARLSDELSVESSSNLDSLDELARSRAGEVREFAAATLSSIGTGDSIYRLLRTIRQEQNAAVRDNMIESLRTIRNPAAVFELARCSREMADLALHRECRNAISAMERPEAVRNLIDLLEQEPGGSDLEPLLYALAHVTSENAVPVLRSAALSRNQRIVISSIAGLAWIRTRTSLRTLFQIMEGDDKDRSAIARAAVLWSAAEHPDETLITVYQEVVERGADRVGISTALNCLTLTPSEEAVSVLERQSQAARDPVIRLQAQSAVAAHKSRWRRTVE